MADEKPLSFWRIAVMRLRKDRLTLVAMIILAFIALGAIFADVINTQIFDADPDNTDEFWRGHPYWRWATFAAHGAADVLVRTSASVFVAQGSQDRSGIVHGEAKAINVQCTAVGGDNASGQVIDNGTRKVAATGWGCPRKRARIELTAPPPPSGCGRRSHRR